ncbi:MAG: glycosyltransferase, partial [Vicinamibacterales bacterium]
RVVHAAKFYPPVPGGMETVVGDLCRGTADVWDVSVVSAAASRETVIERVDEVAVTRCGTRSVVQSVPLCPSYPPALWRTAADCVVLHEPNPLAAASLFLRMPARRLIVWHHSDLLRPWWAPYSYGLLQRALYRRADCVVVSSPNLAAASALVQCARRVEVVPFGVALERFQASGDAVERDGAVPGALEAPNALNALESTTAGPLVLFVGRLVYYKGIEVLIDAMARCEGTLVIAGEGPLEASLRARAAAHGLASRVRFLGRVTDEALPALYRAADLFVLPSVAYTETFGVVQVEAMAAGVPVISTDLPTGVPWVNAHGVSGLVVPPGDAAALAAAIGRLTRDPLERAALARGAAARAQALFSRSRMIASFRALVEQVVGEPVSVGALARARSL